MDFAHDHNMTRKPKRICCWLAKILIITLPIIICIGCSAPSFRVYEGPRRPSFSASRIITENEKIWFTQIDNVYLEYSPFKASWYNKKYAQDVEVLPGKHLLYIMHRDLITKANLRVAFEAEAGHTYEVEASLEKFTTVYRVIDLNTSKTIVKKYGPSMD